MKRNLLWLAVLVVLILSGCVRPAPGPTSTPTPAPVAPVPLPEPRLKSAVSLEETLLQRRSAREYADEALTLEEVSQLLWAAQGVTAEWGGRTAPSAGALYPLETYLVVGNVENLAPGVYKYKPERHELVKVRDDDVREELAEASLGQSWVKEGAIDIVIAAVYERTTRKYGDRGVRYVHMEAGHAAQNICLQATALDLGIVTVGAFHDEQVKNILGMARDETPLYVIPVGRST
jgi:SagB-type dehydrogenase family enzyme